MLNLHTGIACGTHYRAVEMNIAKKARRRLIWSQEIEFVKLNVESDNRSMKYVSRTVGLVRTGNKSFEFG